MNVMQSMRDMQDRRGRGLMLVCKKDNMEVNMKSTRIKDILHTEMTVENLEFDIVVVYWRTGNEVEVREYNEKISQEMGEIVERVEARERKIIIVRDFNSHLGYIGYQEENGNGRIMNRFLNKYDHILMNIDDRCKGVYTWERGEMKSVIDCVVVNREMYDRVEEVVVDKERKETEISYHCMLSTFLRVGRLQGGGGDGCWRAQKYFRYSEERVQRYRLQVEEKLETGGHFSMTKINKILLEAAEQHLSTEYRRREKVR